MRTTIDLPDDLFREAKTRAVRQGTTLKNLVTELIRSGLQSSTNGGDVRPLPRKPPPVAIQREPEQATIPARTNRQLYAMLEEEEVQRNGVAKSISREKP